jgi:hypothetical protein
VILLFTMTSPPPPQLQQATERRSAEARARVEATLLAAEASELRVSVSQLARNARVSLSWLYKQPDFIDRAQAIAARPKPDTLTKLRQQIRQLGQEIQRLNAENSELRERLRQLLGGS